MALALGVEKQLAVKVEEERMAKDLEAGNREANTLQLAGTALSRSIIAAIEGPEKFGCLSKATGGFDLDKVAADAWAVRPAQPGRRGALARVCVGAQETPGPRPECVA